jgi:hypothetical protein
MQRNSLFDNPIAIFILFLIIAFTNIILPIYFISILLAGILFLAFLRAIEKRYYYSLFLIIFSFLMIEISQGLKVFSLSLLSYSIYLFIIPKIKPLLSSYNLFLFLKIFIFYCGILLLFQILGNIDARVISIIVINYIFDIFIISFVI